MKPLKLSMCAFGTYVEEHLDFCELKNKSIFLIHGPTGSGKTTILDAICFALYGDTSGDFRNSKNMRSHHARLDQLTEVTFDFELKGQKYRIHRIPEQERLKKSGTGKTIQSPEATFWKLDEEKNLIQSGWKNVTDAVEEVIGFKSSQFRQVIMLPQGEFRKLLLADSLERQNILEKLFRTEYYRAIEELLKKSAKELTDQIKDMEKQKDWYLNKAECETIEDVEKTIQNYEEEIIKIKELLKQKIEKVKNVQEVFIKGKEGNEKLIEKETVEKELEKLKRQIPFIEERKEELKKAVKAATLEETENATRLRSKDLKKCQKDSEELEKKLTEAVKRQKSAEIKLKEQKEKEEERDKLRKEIVTLDGYGDKVNSLESARKKVIGLREDLHKAEVEKDKLEGNYKKIETMLQKQKTMVEEAKEYSFKLSGFKSEYELAEKIYQKRISLDKMNNEYERVLKEYEKDLEDYKRAEAQYIKEKKEFFALQEVWNKGQAAILASSLEENMHCPVCGSIHHPKLAKKEEWMPTEDEIKEKQIFVEKLEKQKDRMKEKENKKNEEKEKLQNSIKNMKEELGENWEIDIKKFNTNMEQAKKLWEEALEKSKKLEKLNQDLENMKQEENEYKETLQKIEELINNKIQIYQNAQGALIEQETSIPESIRNVEALYCAQKEAKDQLNKLSQAFEKAKDNFDEAQKIFTAAKTSKENAQKALDEANEKYTYEKNTFIQKLNEAGFEKYAEYEASKKDEISRNHLEKEIKDFEGNLRSKQDHMNRVKKSCEGIIRVDLNELQDDLKKAELEKDEAIKIENSLSEKIKNDKGLLKDLFKLDGLIQEKEKAYGVVGRLSEVSNGANPFGLTFQRFVLGALLDDITIAATERLKLMSKGRYHLRRTLDRARKNAAGGLELEIFDTYTGIERPVSTLSGGETFLASLSLALGLADVVQAYSGGISLDTIFVDEGFGTLDPESLDFAMKTLIDLQKGGRLVGIISHVPELKERIDARLEVTPTEKGSKAQFKIS